MFRVKSKTDLKDPKNIKRFKFRAAMAEGIKRHIMERVSQQGMGAHGPLADYSTNGIVILKPQSGSKPKVKPTRGWGKYHEGGYKQYREEVGLESDKFVFSNKGQAWRDWMQMKATDAGPLEFGFADERNTMAADAATARNRDHMFALNDAEADMFLEQYLDAFIRELWGE